MEVQTLNLGQLQEHPNNPRRHFDENQLDELAASLAEKGMLNPILARPNGKGFQILAGARRYRAARLAGLKEVPVIVRQLDDAAALELMIVDNLQRADIHPMDEALGYRQLAQYDYQVVDIAEKIGRSVKYVYDRMKLTKLIPQLQKVFLDGQITAGHAILLARLKPEDQRRAMGEPKEDAPRWGRPPGGLFVRECTLFHPDKEDGSEEEPRKAVSVRELAGWIDEHVRLAPEEVDQMVLPETADVLAGAAEQDVKVLRITHELVTPAAAKDGPKVILGRSWERADGHHQSKTCEHSRLAMIEIGPGRGEAFLVCVAKQKCATHWPDHVKAAKAAARAEKKAVAKGADKATAAKERARVEEQKRIEAQKKREEMEGRYKKALPAILAAIVAEIKTLSPKPGGIVAETLLDSVHGYRMSRREAEKLLPVGKTAEDLVRHAVACLVASSLSIWCPDEIIKTAKAFGVNAGILDQVAPAPKPQKPAAATAKGKAKKGGARG